MNKRDSVKVHLLALVEEGNGLGKAFLEKTETRFEYSYQSWYTVSLKVVSDLALDRLAEFRGYYEIDPKRKSLDYGSYVIQDYLKGVVPNRAVYPNFSPRDQVSRAIFNQLTILKSLTSRVDSVLNNIHEELYSEIQDEEIATARALIKVNLRAAGALAGVIIEGHLQKIAEIKGIKITKKNPTVSDLLEPLKSAGVLDTPSWRKISYLADIRNICAHKKDLEPTKEQAEELIQGTEWLIKNVF